MVLKTYTWLDERLGLTGIYNTVFDRKVPKVNWWFTLGSASLILFLLQGLTGMFLAVYYVPSPDDAYNSINYIMNGVTFGWLIRGIHHWGASLMIIVVFVHMLRTFYYAAYKYPREVTWITGVMLLLATLGMGFTGYLLPWKEFNETLSQMQTQLLRIVISDPLLLHHELCFLNCCASHSIIYRRLNMATLQTG